MLDFPRLALLMAFTSRCRPTLTRARAKTPHQSSSFGRQEAEAWATFIHNYGIFISIYMCVCVWFICICIYMIIILIIDLIIITIIIIIIIIVIHCLYMVSIWHYPLVNCDRKLWKDPPCYSWENSHHFDWVMFNSKLLDYERVSNTVQCKNISVRQNMWTSILKKTMKFRRKRLVSMGHQATWTRTCPPVIKRCKRKSPQQNGVDGTSMCKCSLYPCNYINIKVYKLISTLSTYQYQSVYEYQYQCIYTVYIYIYAYIYIYIHITNTSFPPFLWNLPAKAQPRPCWAPFLQPWGTRKRNRSVDCLCL